MTLTVGSELDRKVVEALERGARWLLDTQDRDGWWKGDLETNVTMDAEDLMLREFLGIRGEERTRGSAAWIRSKQREDGTWASFHGGPPELSTTVEAYLALRLAGDPLEPVSTWAGRFQRLDRWLHAYQRHPVRPLRRLAMRRAARWIIERQEADGGWGGIQPPWVYSIIALHLLGYALDHPVLRSALEGLESFTVREGEHVWLEACQSPVWDTGLALIALSEAGLAADHPALVRAADWLLEEEVRKRGD